MASNPMNALDIINEGDNIDDNIELDYSGIEDIADPENPDVVQVLKRMNILEDIKGYRAALKNAKTKREVDLIRSKILALASIATIEKIAMQIALKTSSDDEDLYDNISISMRR